MWPICVSNPIHSVHLPSLDVREQDIDYQQSRVALFRHLLRSMPHSVEQVVAAAKVDIPPVLRGEVWTAILDPTGEAIRMYATVDKEAPGPLDHQIDLDIPRCHQYNDLLSSPEGRRKFRRVLKVRHSGNKMEFSNVLFSVGLRATQT